MSDRAQQLVVGWLWVATIFALILASAARFDTSDERTPPVRDAQGIDVVDLIPMM